MYEYGHGQLSKCTAFDYTSGVVVLGTKNVWKSEGIVLDLLEDQNPGNEKWSGREMAGILNVRLLNCTINGFKFSI